MARSLAPLGALLFLLGLAAAASATDAPFVVAHKKVALSRPKPGVERLAVSVDLYNQGSATAYDVAINDDSWPTEAFELVSGEKSKTLERLDRGATASHTFILETKTQGRFQGSPAIIRYRIPTKTALQEAYSTPIFPLDILAERAPEKKFEWVINRAIALHPTLSFFQLLIFDLCFWCWLLCVSGSAQAKRLVAKYGALVSVVSFVGMFIYLVASPSKSSGKSSKKRR
ncbi:hypothetical protein EJB05_00987 [Eragrostis curvula]|uniref:Translocon-associated protein subunit beta n=1 Tax=Eragrostis curvula TaxID=38414 RepID=A0A5J9WNH8_9POAL|nr:hypothetical protein EJB05_00987 [Eragrostis curvula]